MRKEIYFFNLTRDFSSKKWSKKQDWFRIGGEVRMGLFARNDYPDISVSHSLSERAFCRNPPWIIQGLSAGPPTREPVFQCTGTFPENIASFGSVLPITANED